MGICPTIFGKPPFFRCAFCNICDEQTEEKAFSVLKIILFYQSFSTFASNKHTRRTVRGYFGENRATNERCDLCIEHFQACYYEINSLWWIFLCVVCNFDIAKLIDNEKYCGFYSVFLEV